MTKTDVKKDFVMPILVLTLICLITSAILSYTNDVTAPIIEETERLRAEAARLEALPEADSFELMTLSGLPETITEVYRAQNGAGYVFMITTDGYGGSGTMNLICGIDAKGRITMVNTLSHNETPGLGSKTTEDDFRNQFTGKDGTLEGVSAISGATVSSNYYINAVKDAFTAFEIAKEAE